MPYIRTERLVIRPLTESDADDVLEWRSDPIVNRFMPFPCDTDIEVVKEWIKRERQKKYRLAVVLKNKVIGDVSARWREKEHVYEIGYNLNRSYWGKGYATEAAKAIIKWTHEQFDAHDFTAFYAKDNAASGRVLEKCGFVQEYTGQYSRDNGNIVFKAVFVRLHID
jgi:ribosomal-protein-alanine N-acetyltransferase